MARNSAGQAEIRLDQHDQRNSRVRFRNKKGVEFHESEESVMILAGEAAAENNDERVSI